MAVAGLPTETSLLRQSKAHLARTVAYKPASLLNGVRAVPAVNRLPECVCSCGEYCWSQGVCDCSGDCNDCTEYKMCTTCMNTCCGAAGAQCGGHGGILS